MQRNNIGWGEATMRGPWLVPVLGLMLAACGDCGGTTTTTCDTHSECGSGKWCDNGVCTAGTACTSDNGCSATQVCRNSVCVPGSRDSGLLVDSGGTDAAHVDTGSDAATQPACGITFDPSPVDFGASRIGVPVTRVVTMHNASQTAVTVFSVQINPNSSANEYAVDGANSFTSGSVPVGQSQSVTIIYTPRDGVPDSATLQVNTQCQPTAVFTVTLSAEFKFSPAIAVTEYANTSTPGLVTLPFGDVRQSFPSDKMVFIKNTQPESALVIQSIVVSPSTGNDFRIIIDRSGVQSLSQWTATCTAPAVGCDVARQETCVEGACQETAGTWVDQVAVRVQFVPSRLGQQSAQLRIVNNDTTPSADANYVISLTANGIAAYDCEARSFADGTWDGSKCVWACQVGHVDANLDLNASQTPGSSNGCEYACTGNAGTADPPDLSGLDADCDGIDGEVEEGWFVAIGAGTNGNGSKASPFNNLADGISNAQQSGTKKHVYISGETYSLASTLELPDGVSLFGGYDYSQNWRTRTGTTSINGAVTALHAASVNSLAHETRLQKLVVNAANGTLAQRTSIALQAVDAPGLILEGVTLNAGAGLAGANGTAGGTGQSGEDGDVGLGGCNWGAGWANCREGGRGGQSFCAGAKGGAGGNGGFHEWPRNDVANLNSGTDGVVTLAGKYFDSASGPFDNDYNNDGDPDDVTGYIIELSGATNENNNGRFTITSVVSATRIQINNAVGIANESGIDWALKLQRGPLDGESNSAAQAGGQAGGRQGANLYNVCYGQTGSDGADGRHGNPGNGGAVVAGRIVGNFWVDGDGTGGTNGVGDSAGGTGGGGGAGGDCEPDCLIYLNPWNVCLIVWDDYCNLAPQCVTGQTSWGGGGGGGGSAGCPGTAGTAGTAGGSSIGILAIRSPLIVTGGAINAGSGAVGGSGGAGGAGGVGGAGQTGGVGTVTSGAGGDGGGGGRGGFGGGGAGGAGGDSIGIVYTGTAPTTGGGCAITPHAAASGGSGGAGAPTTPVNLCNRANAAQCGTGANGPNGRSQQTLQQ